MTFIVLKINFGICFSVGFFAFLVLSRFNKRKISLVFISGQKTPLVIRKVHEGGFKDTVFAKKENYSFQFPVKKHVLLEFICGGLDARRTAFNTDLLDSLKTIPFFNLVA